LEKQLKEPSTQCVEDIFARVNIRPKDNYVIWGAGVIGEHVLEKLKAKKITPLAFVDDINPDRWGKEIQGIEIISLEKAKGKYPKARYILSSGFNYKIVPKAEGLDYIYYEKFCFQGNEKKINKAFNLFEDITSRYEFLFRFYCRDNPQTAVIPKEDRYFFKMEKDSVFIDGGAYVGDTIEKLLLHKPRAIYAFEPDPQNFDKLCENTTRIKNVCILPGALYDTRDI
jgi:hypothetical protein